MKVRHGFATIRAVIKYKAEAVLLKAQLSGDFGSFQQQMTEQGLVFGLRFGDARDGFLRDQENVCRCLWCNVMEGDDGVVLIDNPGRDFASDDFLEKSTAHILILREVH